MVYRSAVAWWFYVIAFGLPVVCLYYVYRLMGIDAGITLYAVMGVGVMIMTLPLWLLVATYYRIDEGVLSIRCGPFFWRIPLKEIESIRRSRSSLSSPALSMDRLWIRYSGGKRILISPKDREEFIRAIRAIPDLADKIEQPGPGFSRPHGTRTRGTSGIGPGLAVVVIFQLLFALSFAAVIIVQGEKPVRVSTRDGILAVSGAGYHVKVPIGDITNVSLVDSPPHVGRKVNGYNLGSTLRGAFRCNDAGVAVDCQVFVDLDSPPFVVVRTSDLLLVVNLENAGATGRLYGELTSGHDGN